MVLLINPVSLKLSSKQVIKVCSFWLLSTVMSSSELVMDDERLIHIKEVTQHHAVQCFAREPAECSLQLAKPSSKLDNFPG